MAGNKLDHGGVKTQVFNPNKSWVNADSAFNWLYPTISSFGQDFGGTKAIFNLGFYMQQPWERDISAPYRKFSPKYAEAEWDWYKSGDPSIDTLGELYGKVPPIWEKMADENREVRSNYGWQWGRESQLDKVIEKLKYVKDTRHAVISIYDGKEIDTYQNDTPCTYAVQFDVIGGKLCMSVFMRSCDVWFGFCNDQYCFSKLQEMVAERVNLPMGWYYHFAHNFHIYNHQLNKI